MITLTPWAHGPFEIILHAEMHYRDGDDLDRRIAIVGFDGKAANTFVQLKSQKIRIGTMDLKIAAITIANGAILISRNLRDFAQVPNLTVEDWTK